MKQQIPQHVKWLFDRNLIQDYTSLVKIAKMIKNKGKAYVGFDMTQPSLQLGNMVCLNIAEILFQKGVETFIVLGGATTLIGDPSGKKKEREISDIKKVQENLKANQVFLQEKFPNLKVLNNATWWKNISTIDFLRLSKNINVNTLLDRKLIRNRLNSSGMSFTEFSYTIIQGIDFYYLAKTKNIYLQFGGSDQWGNLLTGHNLILKKLKKPSACFSTPLLVDEQNRKFGKTESNVLFLNPKYTSSYELYQILFNQPDEMLELLFSKLTVLSLKQIQEIMALHKQNKAKRLGQIELAKMIITKTRSLNDFENAQRISRLVFQNDFKNLQNNDFSILLQSPLFKKHVAKNIRIEELLVDINFASSLSDARRLIKASGIKINQKLVTSPTNKLSYIKPFFDMYYIINKGKKNIILVKI